MKNRIKRTEGETGLQRAVRQWANDSGEGYAEDGPKGAFKDLFYGGCQSGMVGFLVYYTDTEKFYKKHRVEIGRLLGEVCNDTGEGPAGLFGDKWETDDPMALDTFNQNLLAWFGFEETARRMADTLGWEV